MIERAKAVAKRHIARLAALQAGAEFEEGLSTHTCGDCAHRVVDAIFENEEPHPWGECDAIGCQHKPGGRYARTPPAPGVTAIVESGCYETESCLLTTADHPACERWSMLEKPSPPKG
jgi:hypothetical protein